MRIDVKRRLELLRSTTAPTSASETPKVDIDPLKFRDRKKYADRLKEAQSKTEREDAIVNAHRH